MNKWFSNQFILYYYYNIVHIIRAILDRAVLLQDKNLKAKYSDKMHNITHIYQ